MKYKEFFEKFGRVRFKYFKTYTYTTKHRFGWKGLFLSSTIKVPPYEGLGTPIGNDMENYPDLEEIYQMFKERMIDECFIE